MRIFFSLLVTFFILSVSAQSRKALKEMEYAKMSIQENDLDAAIGHVNKAIKESPNYFEAYMFKADIFMTQDHPAKASKSYQKALEISGKVFINYKLGQALMQSLQYEEAETAFLAYLDYDKIREESKARAEHYLDNCRFGKVAVKNPVSFDPHSLGAGVNTKDYQYHPAISIDGKLLVYTQLDGRDENFYSVKKEEGVWGKGEKMLGPINTRNNEGVQTLTADGRYMIFTICNREDSRGSCDIYIAKKLNNGMWSAGMNLGDSINTKHWESQPSLSPDGQTLYFVRGHKMTDKNTDIYFSKINKSGNWGKAKKMSETINTPYREMSPYIHFDNQTLYFASQGHAGMGDADIFVSRWNMEKQEWGTPENLGYPINTPYEEFGLVVASNGTTSYYSSDQIVEGHRTRNIYEFELPLEKSALPVAWLRGVVTDEVTGNPLRATIEVVDLKSGLPWLSVRSRKSGSFFAVLPANVEYALNVENTGYLFYSANIALGDQSYDESLVHPVKLSPIKQGGKMVLNNIFFDYDSFQLQDKSATELKKLYDFLVLNPELNIRIDGHTDNQGGDSYNLKLSEQRAGSVKRYLVASGIDASQISVKGFGASVPIATNETEEGRKLNRRTEIIVL